MTNRKIGLLRLVLDTEVSSKGRFRSNAFRDALGQQVHGTSVINHAEWRNH